MRKLRLMSTKGRAFLAAIYINAFVLGAAIMGFEMLGSRYLNPLFGGSIFTWGALISTVLLSLMIGAFIGGHLADRSPSPVTLSFCIAGAALYFFALPTLGAGFFDTIPDIFGYDWGGLLVAALVLNLVPISLFGMFTPFAVRLMIRSTTGSGRLVGQVSAIQSFGSIVGTLVTTFVLIPWIGTRSITMLFGVVVALSAVSLFALKWLWEEEDGDAPAASADMSSAENGPLAFRDPA